MTKKDKEEEIRGRFEGRPTRGRLKTLEDQIRQLFRVVPSF